MSKTPRRTEAQWFALVASYDPSRTTKKQFCQDHAISPNSLNTYLACYQQYLSELSKTEVADEAKVTSHPPTTTPAPCWSPILLLDKPLQHQSTPPSTGDPENPPLTTLCLGKLTLTFHKPPDIHWLSSLYREVCRL